MLAGLTLHNIRVIMNVSTLNFFQETEKMQMILDKIDQCGRYFSVHADFKAGFDFIKKALDQKLPAGKYEIDGEKVFAMIQEYETRAWEKPFFEGHKRYIDLQFIAEGEERMDLINIARAEVTQAYDEKIEAAFFAPKGECTRGIFSAGDFAIFFPEDLHQPGLRIGEDACKMKKIIVKIEL